MSKILEVKSCTECRNYKFQCWEWKCFANKHDPKVVDNPDIVLPDCPLKDSDAWKKELLEWIEEEKFDCRDDNWVTDIVVLVEDLKQKIQEM